MLGSNPAGFSLMFAVLYSSRANRRRIFGDEKIYNAMVWMTIFQCCMELVSFYVDGRPSLLARLLNRASNTLLYTISPLFALCRPFFPIRSHMSPCTPLKKPSSTSINLPAASICCTFFLRRLHHKQSRMNA